MAGQHTRCPRVPRFPGWGTASRAFSMTATSHSIGLPDRYRVTRRIAGGGMATVYACEAQVLGRLVAVKVLSPGLAADPSARARFQREGRAVARVSDHPNVVTIYDIGESDGTAFITMEYFPGGTVSDRLKDGTPVPLPTVVRWLDDAAAALDAAHAAGIVHRDVKPANLLLDPNGVLKVGDFGIATLGAEAPLTMTGQVVGTAAYFAPEQAMGRPATPASDRYSLAVVAFELLTGSRLFPEGPPAAQARAHVDAPPPQASQLAPELPPAVDAVLARGLAKDPEQRPPSAATLVSELAAAVGPTAATKVATPARFSRPAAATPPPPPPPAAAAEPVRSKSGSNVARPLAVAALILGLGVLLAALLAGGGGDKPSPTAHRTRSAARTAPKARSTPKPATTTAAAPAAPADT